ncbi:MAG: 16S rRNA (uracil(1498)-N(3))-methyltransferase [Gracilibacteraceae bacterium]|jgi:16S rRNA (uracil1498-N3)-methyltransferase|nr:16S rRNA (uracil(1498)-N(3))-methyltransferase [Gracilibacteraceae bacterium]
MTRRFRLAGKGDEMFWLEGDEFRHLTTVLRLGPGARIVGFDEERAYLGIITNLRDGQACCRIESALPETGEPAARVFLVMGLTKGDKIEWVIQKGTELGMAGFVPLAAERSVARPDERRQAAGDERRRKIAAAAVKQCGRVRQPEIFPLSGWEALPALLPPDTACFLAWEEEKERSFKAALAGVDWRRPLAVLIGPEGGFTRAEAERAAKELGAAPVSLGTRVLRAETAALAALTLALAASGDLG